MKLLGSILVVSLVAIVAVNIGIQPQSVRAWQTGQGHTATWTLKNDGKSLHINHYRDMESCTPTELSCVKGSKPLFLRKLLAWEDLRGVEVVHFSAEQDTKVIEDTYGLEFDFGTEKVLITIEPRLEQGEIYNATQSWLRSYEVGYFAGTAEAMAHFYFQTLPDNDAEITRSELSLTPEMTEILLKELVLQAQKRDRYPGFYTAGWKGRDQLFMKALKAAKPGFRKGELGI